MPERLLQLHTEKQEVLDVDECGQATHKVLNQAGAFCNFNAFDDVALRSGVMRHDGRWGSDVLEELGAKVGSQEWQQKAADANRQVPRLETFDRFGNRHDAVQFHPAYHELMELGLSSGAAAFAWQNLGRPGAHVIRGALMHLMYQLDQGVCCPITMTFAAVPALAKMDIEDKPHAAFLQSLKEKLIAGKYNPADIPLSSKDGATCGMSMTEKQGGSDVRANTTQATPVVPGKEASGDAFWLIGHKWFTSAPMSDAFLTLAQSKEGVSCFVVPRWRPDGRKNAGFNIQRLKEKIGDKSNASSEIEYRNAWGIMIGQPGRGDGGPHSLGLRHWKFSPDEALCTARVPPRVRKMGLWTAIDSATFDATCFSRFGVRIRGRHRHLVTLGKGIGCTGMATCEDCHGSEQVLCLQTSPIGGL